MFKVLQDVTESTLENETKTSKNQTQTQNSPQKSDQTFQLEIGECFKNRTKLRALRKDVLQDLHNEEQAMEEISKQIKKLQEKLSIREIAKNGKRNRIKILDEQIGEQNRRIDVLFGQRKEAKFPGSTNKSWLEGQRKIREKEENSKMVRTRMSDSENIMNHSFSRQTKKLQSKTISHENDDVFKQAQEPICLQNQTYPKFFPHHNAKKSNRSKSVSAQGSFNHHKMYFQTNDGAAYRRGVG